MCLRSICVKIYRSDEKLTARVHGHARTRRPFYVGDDGKNVKIIHNNNEWMTFYVTIMY